MYLFLGTFSVVRFLKLKILKTKKKKEFSNKVLNNLLIKYLMKFQCSIDFHNL